MKCPDCKVTLTRNDIVDSNYVDPKGDGIGYDENVYRCFKCGCEWNESDLD